MKPNQLREQAESLPEFDGAAAVRKAMLDAAERMETYEAALMHIADPEDICNREVQGPWMDVAQHALGFHIADGADWYESEGKELTVPAMMERVARATTVSLSAPEAAALRRISGWSDRTGEFSVHNWAALMKLFERGEFGILHSQFVDERRLVRNEVMISPRGIERLRAYRTAAAGAAAIDDIVDLMIDGSLPSPETPSP